MDYNNYFTSYFHPRIPNPNTNSYPSSYEHWDPFYSYYRNIGLIKLHPSGDKQNLEEGYPNPSSSMTMPNLPTLHDLSYRGWTNNPRQLEPKIDYPLQFDSSLSSFKREMQK